MAGARGSGFNWAATPREGGGLGERVAPYDARWTPWSNGKELEGIRLEEGASASFRPPGDGGAMAPPPE